jgi:hypothetical protein
MTATAEAFVLTNRLEAYEGDTRVFARADQVQVPRDLA